MTTTTTPITVELRKVFCRGQKSQNGGKNCNEFCFNCGKKNQLENFGWLVGQVDRKKTSHFKLILGFFINLAEKKTAHMFVPI